MHLGGVEADLENLLSILRDLTWLSRIEYATPCSHCCIWSSRHPNSGSNNLTEWEMFIAIGKKLVSFYIEQSVSKDTVVTHCNPVNTLQHCLMLTKFNSTFFSFEYISIALFKIILVLQIWKGKILYYIRDNEHAHNSNMRYSANNIVVEAQSTMRSMYILTFICIKSFWKNTKEMRTVVHWGGPTKNCKVGKRGGLIFHCLYFYILFKKKRKLILQDHKDEAFVF